MHDEDRTNEQIMAEIQELRQRLADSERDNAEEMVTKSEAIRSQDYLRTVLETMPDGFWVVDTQGRVREANAAYCRMSGYSQTELLSLSISDIDAIEKPVETEARIKRIIEKGSETFETRHRRKDGSIFDVEMSVSFLDSGGGRFVCFCRDITERKRAEAKLLDALAEAQRFSLALDHVSAHIYMKDTKSHYIYANRSTLELFGCSADELVGCDATRFFPMDVVDRLREVDSRVFRGEQTTEEIEVTYAEGRRCVYLEIKTPIYDTPESETISCLLGISTDITERKQAEEALRESEKLYRSLFDNMLNGYAYCRMHFDQNRPQDFTYLNVNSSFEALTGLKDVVGKKVSEVIPGIRESDPELFEVYGRVALTGNPERLETYVQSLGAWFSISVYSSQKEHFVAVFDVITERKKAEEALRESEEKFKSLSEHAISGIYLIQDGVFKYVNPKFAEMFGYTVEELQEVMPFKYLVYAEDLAKVEEQVGRRISGEVESVQYAFRGLRKNGQIFQVEIYGSGTFHNGKPAALGTILDITERKQAEEAREKLQAQLTQAQKMESVGRLAGGVAHDFNNMLGVILGHSEMAMDQVDSTHPLHADLQEIQKAAKRSADLTRQLLAFARKQTVAPRVLDLNETVEGMLKMLRRLIGEDIDLAWLPTNNVWPVKVDPSQIDQVLANLCVNARDAIGGIGKVTIETETFVFDEAYCADHAGAVAGEYVLLAVSDNGCGMDEETQGRLFEPFFTTKGVGEGTGLGLATVYGIVKQNNGFINVYSEPGQGTTFKIYLPRHAAKAEQTSKIGVAEPIGRGHETILLVEDEPAILKMTTIMLERQGYTVLQAGTPGEAVRLAEAHPGEINLLMTDVVMPEMNGRDLAKNILSLYPNLKRLFMSGYTANVIAHHGVLDEGVNFIQKPFSMQDLAAKVRQAIGEGTGL